MRVENVSLNNTTEPTFVRETLLDTLGSLQGSALRTYQEIYVGHTSMIALLRYELLVSFLSSLPGALGFFLRKTFTTRLLGAAGSGTVLGSHITLRNPSQIFLGDNVFVDGYAVLDAKGSGSQIRMGHSVLVGKNSILSCAMATIELGDDVSIGPNSVIRAGIGPVNVGSHVTMGPCTVLISGTPGYERLDVPMNKQVGSCEGISIGNDVWIGVGARIVDGVRVGCGSVVGAGAVVVQNVPDFTVVAGIPAKPIGSRKKLEMEGIPARGDSSQ